MSKRVSDVPGRVLFIAGVTLNAAESKDIHAIIPLVIAAGLFPIRVTTHALYFMLPLLEGMCFFLGRFQISLEKGTSFS